MEKLEIDRARSTFVNPSPNAMVQLSDISWQDVRRQVAVAERRRQAYVTRGLRRILMSGRDWLSKPVVEPAANV